jgi:hypothetical protein
MYPNNQQVCIACFNSKPENAVFVFSANWFSTFQCDWRCKPGFVGPNCEITVNVAVYVAGCLMATLLLSGMIVCVLGERRRRKQAMDEDHADGAAPSENTIVPAAQRIQPANVVVPPMAVDIGKKRPTTDIIAFKENAEIRIKFL